MTEILGDQNERRIHGTDTFAYELFVHLQVHTYRGHDQLHDNDEYFGITS